ncbi:hypothetical protein ACOPJQ_01720 [Luteimonas dalianensis]|uniref:hypothetical protein n=1 Tax=Luteimonas dalianensis TaxID=1148196 RepID=UPI003BF1F816
MIRALLLATLLTLLATLPRQAPAQAQINRCTAPDGTSIYTDRECSALGAVERLPRDRSEAANTARRNAYRGGCARSIHQLIQEMTLAIDASDVNRLAALYHWPGTSHGAGHRLMDRLDRIARVPVIDIVAERAATPVAAAEQPGISATFASTLQVRRRTPAAPTTRSPPVALRVHQSAGTGAAPSRTRFALRQHLGCWWVSL